MRKLSAAEIKQQAEEKAARNLVLEDFVLHSECISGRGYDSGVADAKQVFLTSSKSVERHLKLAQDIMHPGYNYVGIALINAALTQRTRGWYRTGIEGMLIGLIPDGRHVEGLVDALDKEIKAAVSVMQGNSEHEKDVFAWHCHDELMCLRAFKSLNERTARAVYGHVRAILGLEPFVIDYAKSADYFRKVHEYRDNVFLPRLRHNNVLAA